MLQIDKSDINFRYLTEELPNYHARQQFLALYNAALKPLHPVVVELGTNIGLSAAVFLQACGERDGQLVSVDIEDCSSASSDPRFHFIRANSTDALSIIERYPFLRAGIDVLYVDSLHERSHVEREIAAWWPHLKQGATIAFDDVDAHIYRPGQRKEHLSTERANDAILEFVRDFFWSNLDDVEMKIHFGSTGLAMMTKMSPLGAPSKVAKRTRNGLRRTLIQRIAVKLRNIIKG